MLTRFINLLVNRLRLSKPWNYKVPFLIAIPYYFITAYSFSFQESLLVVGYSLMTIIGIAGFGYLTNDMADKEIDRKAGKPNIAVALEKFQLVLLLIFFTVTALVPWVVYFPLDATSFSLLSAEFILFILYVMPPIRLKERGFAGVVTDALYAHVNPALLASYTYYLLSGKAFNDIYWLVAALGAWQLFLGMRNILLHQLEDASNDRLSGTSTVVTKKGEDWVIHLLKKIIVPVEVMIFFLFTLVATGKYFGLSMAWPIYVITTVLNLKFIQKKGIPPSFRERLYLFFDAFYVGWIPVIVLSVLCLSDYRMLVLLLIHLYLFKNGLIPLVTNLYYLSKNMFLQILHRR
jgi:4-hydroxybenzoate polyprenyltransferase